MFKREIQCADFAYKKVYDTVKKWTFDRGYDFEVDEIDQLQLNLFEDEGVEKIEDTLTAEDVLYGNTWRFRFNTDDTGMVGIIKALYPRLHNGVRIAKF